VLNLIWKMERGIQRGDTEIAAQPRSVPDGSSSVGHGKGRVRD